jgi:hypothetical protein
MSDPSTEAAKSDQDLQASGEEQSEPAAKKSKTESLGSTNDEDETPTTELVASTSLFNPTSLSAYITFYRSHKPQKKKSKIPPEVLTTRRHIQHCCRDNNLHSALQTLVQAIEECVYLEAQSFYNLLSLCDGSFVEGRVHVGTPRQKQREDDEKKKDLVDDSCDQLVQAAPNEAVTTVMNGNEGSASKPPSISLSQRLHHANEIHSLLTKLHIPCTEPTYTALIRLSSRAGDFDRAERYLDEAEGTQQCKVKLRMYSALIKGYCGDYEDGKESSVEKGGGVNRRTKEDLVKALKIWERMYNHSGGSKDCTISNDDDTAILFGEGISPKINLTEIEYSSLIRAATALHDVPVMDRVLSDLAERVFVPGFETTESILNWFRADCSEDLSSNEDGATALECVNLPPREGASIGSVTNCLGGGWVIYNQCTIDSSTGLLTLGKAEDISLFSSDTKQQDTNTIYSLKLKPVELTNAAWEEMRKMNETIVLEGQVEGHLSQFQGGGKGKKRPRGDGENGGNNNNGPTKSSNNNHQNKRCNEWRIKAWKQFESFIENHPTYNVVIDGANVGYFQQNFFNAPKHVDYKQIDWLLRHLLEHAGGKHIILFLHERHFSPKLCPQWAFNMIRAWDGNQAPYDRLSVYRTPAGMNDDWFWMHAALMSGGKCDATPVLAITNDEMRDHHFQMLAQGSFLRWKERHQVHFDFGQYNKHLGRRDVMLSYPSKYSRRIQRLTTGECEAIVIPLPKKGDEGRFVDGLHVADDSAPSEETYVVIRKAG